MTIHSAILGRCEYLGSKAQNFVRGICLIAKSSSVNLFERKIMDRSVGKGCFMRRLFIALLSCSVKVTVSMEFDIL